MHHLTYSQQALLASLDKLRCSKSALVLSKSSVIDAFPSMNPINLDFIDAFLGHYGYSLLKEYFVPGPFGSRWLHIRVCDKQSLDSNLIERANRYGSSQKALTPKEFAVMHTPSNTTDKLDNSVSG